MNQQNAPASTNSVLLIYPPMDSDYFTVGVNDSPPVGLVALKNYAVQKLGDAAPHIELVDGEHQNLASIIEKIRTGNYSMVGIQPMMASYRTTLDIAAAAKNAGALVVLGGHHATQLASKIIANRRGLIDAVVSRDGEEALLGLIQGRSFEQIPNMVYWDDKAGKVVRTKELEVPINSYGITHIDTDLLALYRKNTGVLERGSEASFRAYSHKGCDNRTNSQYCFFCGRADRGLRFKDPGLYLQELDTLARAYGAVHIFEIGDDFLQSTEWLSRLVAEKKASFPNLNVNLKIFARANRVTEENIGLLKALNVTEVAIGFESGSEEILRRIHKRATPQQNLEAARLLFSHGIDTVASFVIGLPGENEDTLRLTHEHAMKVVELAEKHLGHKPAEIIANLIEVNPGAPAFNRVLERYPEFRDRDLIGVREMQHAYFRTTFNLDSQEAVDELVASFAKWGKLINGLGKYTYPAGWEKRDMSSDGRPSAGATDVKLKLG